MGDTRTTPTHRLSRNVDTQSFHRCDRCRLHALEAFGLNGLAGWYSGRSRRRCRGRSSMSRNKRTVRHLGGMVHHPRLSCRRRYSMPLPVDCNWRRQKGVIQAIVTHIVFPGEFVRALCERQASPTDGVTEYMNGAGELCILRVHIPRLTMFVLKSY